MMLMLRKTARSIFAVSWQQLQELLRATEVKTSPQRHKSHSQNLSALYMIHAIDTLNL